MNRVEDDFVDVQKRRTRSKGSKRKKISASEDSDGSY